MSLKQGGAEKEEEAEREGDSVVLSSADSCRNIHIYAGYILTQ